MQQKIFAMATIGNFTGVFNLNTNLLTLTDTTSYDGTGWAYYYTVYNPNQEPLYIGSESSPDGSQASPLPKSVSLKTNSNNVVYTGVYTITQTVFKTGETDVVTVDSVSFVITTPSAVLTFTANEFDSSIVVSDDTIYEQGGVIPTGTTTITLQYPSDASYNPSGIVTATDEDLVISYDKVLGDGLFVNGKYTYTLARTVTYDIGDGFTATAPVGFTGTVTPTATYDMGTMYCVLKTLKKRRDAAIKVNNVLADEYSVQYDEAIRLMEMIRDSYIANQLADTETYLAKFYEITNSTSDCTSCDTGTTTKLVIPISWIETVEVVSSSSPALTVTKSVEQAGNGGFYKTFTIDLDIGSGAVYAKTVWLDPNNGSDSTGTIGSPLFPFKTFNAINADAACMAIGSNLNVIAMAGIYAEEFAFNSSYNIYMAKGALLDCNNALTSKYSPTVYGYGQINCDTLIVDSLTSDSCNANITVDKIDCVALLGAFTVGYVGFINITSRIIYYSRINTTSIRCAGALSNISIIGAYLLSSSSNALVTLTTNAGYCLKFIDCSVEINNTSAKLYAVSGTANVVHKNTVFYITASAMNSGAGTLNIATDTNCIANLTMASAGLTVTTNGVSGNGITTIYTNTDVLLNRQY